MKATGYGIGCAACCVVALAAALLVVGLAGEVVSYGLNGWYENTALALGIVAAGLAITAIVFQIVRGNPKHSKFAAPQSQNCFALCLSGFCLAVTILGCFIGYVTPTGFQTFSSWERKYQADFIFGCVGGSLAWLVALVLAVADRRAAIAADVAADGVAGASVYIDNTTPAKGELAV